MTGDRWDSMTDEERVKELFAKMEEIDRQALRAKEELCRAYWGEVFAEMAEYFGTKAEEEKTGKKSS